MPIMPMPIWVISSWCEWNMKLPCCRSVNSYFAVSPALMYGCVSPPTPSMPLGR